MQITAQMVKELREATGAGILEAKKALEAHEGDFDKSVDFLREKGLAKAAKKAGREANEGRIELYSHTGNRVGVMVELNCETDFVARNEQFVELAHDLALHIAAASPTYLTKEEVPQEVLDRELAVLTAQAEAEGRPANIVEKIVAGRISKFYEENCLLEQKFIKDESVTIQALIIDSIRTLGENIQIRRFARYELGEAV